MIHKLRPYQDKAETDIRLAYRQGYHAPLFVLPTGAGKTHIFTSIAVKAEAKGNRTLIIVHRSYLWRQVSNKLNEIGVPHGIIAPGHTPTADKIQIASVDTLIKRLDRIREPDLIIFDEAHHVIKKNKWGRVPEYFPEARILGVTATPCRTSGQGLGIDSGGFFDKIVVGPSILELTPDYIVPYKLFAPEIGVDMSGVHRMAGDYNRKETLLRVDKKKIIGSVPAHYRKLCYGIPAIAFCVSVKHAEHVAQEFNENGISAAVVFGKTPENRRSFLFKGLASGKFLVLCSCDLVSEGFDVPVCGCAICLRPTQSMVLCLQQWGRASRIAPGKKFAYILDHVGNYTRHGMPDADHIWDLDGMGISKKQIAEASITIKTCPNCFNVHKPAPVCPECGHIYDNDNNRMPDQVDGQLQEIKTARELKLKKRIVQGRAETLEELQEIGRERGYKPAWAYHVWNSRNLKKERKNDIKILQPI